MSQVWQVDSLGGFMYSDQLSDTLRQALQPVVKFRQLCDAKDGTQKELNTGDEFTWNVYGDALDAADDQGLSETQAMPETSYKIRQGRLTITEMGNSVPYTGKLNNLSKQPVTEVIHKVLKNDAKKTLDVAAFRQFKRTLLRVAPTGGNSTTAVTLDTDGVTAITNNVEFGKDHVKAIVDLMKERNIPPYMGDDYMAIAWPSTYRTFKNNLESIHQYTDQGFGMILNGEIGRYEGCRFIEQTNVQKGGAVDSTTYNPRKTADPWNNGKSDWIFFMGEDTVAEAICIPEEIRGKIPSDYGRSRGVAWYYLGGFGIIHGYDADSVNDGRIVMWDSAA